MRRSLSSRIYGMRQDYPRTDGRCKVPTTSRRTRSIAPPGGCRARKRWGRLALLDVREADALDADCFSRQRLVPLLLPWAGPVDGVPPVLESLPDQYRRSTGPRAVR